MFKTGRTYLAATAAVLALTATACGSKGGDGGTGGGGGVAQPAPDSGKGADLDPAALLKLVGEKTSAAKSAKVEISNDIGTASKSSMTGAISWEHGLQGEMTGTMGGGMAGALSKAGSDGSFTARYLSEAMYVNMGDGMAPQIGGKHWIKYGYADLAKLMGAAGDSMKSQLQNADPISSVRALIAAGQVTKAGQETVNGVKATKYTGDLAVEDLAKSGAKGLSADQAEALRKQFAAAGITTDHIELWISGDDLLVKKVEKFSTKAGDAVSTASYSDYGTKVTAVEPNPLDTVDFVDLVKANSNKTGA
ncbi:MULTISPECIES: hypothetical protein [Kitasatospora]|uniref:Lipoprotein n=1 Tax=Kitasatospora setae (strain ATCC 33774 / DSM 43861 / JCM 3304 / KCC A-0304 / NBRC 14216 / KM-6054) TaxID=452652 RepID=E4N754_KITSK|nr:MULTISPECIES: hypothetical protein [Kitasatospora]BAJ27035.1 hypothetical protein KSE_12020 [Kitasatospora setae KM-6054]